MARTHTAIMNLNDHWRSPVSARSADTMEGPREDPTFWSAEETPKAVPVRAVGTASAMQGATAAAYRESATPMRTYNPEIE